MLVEDATEEMVRAIIRMRIPRLSRIMRDAIILMVAERMPPVDNFWQAIADEVTLITGWSVSANICRKVDERQRSKTGDSDRSV